MENELLADGRKYLLNGPEPTFADIHGIWTFQWTRNLEWEVFIEKTYPTTFAYIDRFVEALAKKQDQIGGPPAELSDKETVETILRSDFFEPEAAVDEIDPLKLTKGQFALSLRRSSTI
jgi:hypothetical protein